MGDYAEGREHPSPRGPAGTSVVAPKDQAARPGASDGNLYITVGYWATAAPFLSGSTIHLAHLRQMRAPTGSRQRSGTPVAKLGSGGGDARLHRSKRRKS